MVNSAELCDANKACISPLLIFLLVFPITFNALNSSHYPHSLSFK